MKWLKQSGLKVNDAKKEICSLYSKYNPPIKLKINGKKINSIKSMNILLVYFDSKLYWQKHIQMQYQNPKKPSRQSKS